MRQIQKTKSDQSQAKEEEAAPAKAADPEVEAHKHLTDELLDEIDSVLEENAQEFVANYIQKGGQ